MNALTTVSYSIGYTFRPLHFLHGVKRLGIFENRKAFTKKFGPQLPPFGPKEFFEDFPEAIYCDSKCVKVSRC